METDKPGQPDINIVDASDKLLVKKLRTYKQEHVLSWWNELTVNEQRSLLNQLRNIDFTLLQNLIKEHIEDNTIKNPKTATLEPPVIIPVPKSNLQISHATEAKTVGENALRNGMVSVVTVAGGLGTRLGVNKPKGTLSICPITHKSIFQLHAEKIKAIMRKYNTLIPWYIMTSLNNDVMTRDFFEENGYFGLSTDNIHFFTQGVLPVLDLQGRLLMDSKSSIVTSPNGHGGTLYALKDSGALSDMHERRVKHIFYHQIDNVLIKIADPVYLGYHIKEGAKMSPKVVRKTDPEEKVGIIGIKNGHLDTVEYSELSEEEKHARNPDGTLKFAMGNPAIYLLDLDFIEKINQNHTTLPYHKAIKKVPCIDKNGFLLKPEKNNAVKFEMFIFDALKHAGKSIVMEVLREEEFSPVKNAEGENSPATAKQSMINLYGRWLKEAGINIPADSDGNVKGTIEISPLYALDPEELKGKIDRKIKFSGELNLQ